ncbi:hypothetical protein SAY87_026404 [Trapa incisa]|uniref:Uncharacterized protein n=1 Tax=Trapa incisa TaxID=236973 RepID=A0AAN7JK57_9MYRT|nr:hypothetical protein SAY87_026404 [Trapa incisa]
MDNGDEFYNHWDTNMFHEIEEEFDRWVDSGYYDSSSPDGWTSSTASKNIVSERNRRKKFNDRLFALRAVVPNISKMDKASIIKDAIDYIQELHEQEKRIQAEILELESGKTGGGGDGRSYHHDHHAAGGGELYGVDLDQDLPLYSRSKKKRTNLGYDSCGGSTMASSIEDLELRVTYMGERTVVVSLTCIQRTDTMVKLCEVFESLKLKIITANITTFSGRLFKTVFIEADEEEREQLKAKIETAMAALDYLDSPMACDGIID